MKKQSLTKTSGDGAKRFEKLGAALGVLVTGHPWKTVAVSVLFFLVFALGLFRAKFSTDYRIFFSKEDPGLTSFEKLESVFTKTDNVLFVVKAKDGSVFQPDALAAIQELTLASSRLPYASRVDSLTNFQHVTATADDITSGDLVAKPGLMLDESELANIRAVAAGEPLVVGSLLSRDFRTGAVNVTLRLPAKDPEEVTQAADAARVLVAEVGAKYPRVEIRASGMAFMNDAFMQTSVKDLGVMIPLMVAVMLIGMVLVMRSAAATGAVASILTLSATMTIAVAGWLRYPLTPPAIAAPMIVLTVAVADGVHVVLAMMEAMHAGASRRDAIAKSLETNLEAITYTWITTIVGFLCLNYSEAPPVRHLANMTCVGVTMAFVYSFTLLPALLSLLPIHARQAAQPQRIAFMERMADFVIRRRRLVLIVSAVVTAVSGVYASRLETNDQFVRYFDESLPFRKDVEFTMANLSGIYRLEYQVASAGPSGIADPVYLENLDAFAVWLRAQPEVEHVYSIADVLKRVNQVMHDDDRAFYRAPESREAAAQELLLYEMGLPSGQDLTDRINVDKSAARLTVTVRDMSTRQMTEFTARAETWMRDHTPRFMWTSATGPVVIFSQLSDRNARSMVQGDFVSLALISLCMIVVLRSLKLGLLSIIPNVIPIVIGYGLWKLFVGQMNIVASVAGSISLGIIVDDTIHFLTKYQALLRTKRITPEDAMRQTLAHIGPAMLGTSAILVLGFGVLTFSSFQMTSYLGWLSVIIVSVAPMADLVLAPALIITLTKERAPEAVGDSESIELQSMQTGAS